MVIALILAILLIVGISLILLSSLGTLVFKEFQNNKATTEYAHWLQERSILIRQTKRIIVVISGILLVGFSGYQLVDGTPMQGFVMEWLNLIVRWAHVVVGIMWIGASFYFVFLENNLNRTDAVRDELAGNLWAIHGGGFYFLEKYKAAPKSLPKNLHWFKYEAYFTWITGFALLAVVYYMDARSFLIDPQVADLSVGGAIAIGIGTMILGWVLYDSLCKSSLSKKPIVFAITGFILLVGTSYFLTEVFSSRAAYIHVGALIGTLMAWNVYFVIVPSQKALVRAARLGLPLDPSLGKKAGERSLHNNYLTLPVIFIMISNHFPSTYGHEYNWIILMVITLASAGIKHYWNLLERGERSRYILPVSIVGMISLALVTSPAFDESSEEMLEVTFSEVKGIVRTRCVQCHSATPTDDQWQVSPNNVMFDTPEQIVAQSERIMIRSVRTKSMPLGNKTLMTDDEREKIKAWILQGSKVE